MDRLLSPDMMPITLVGLGLLSALILAVVVLVMRGSRTPDVSQRLSEFAGRTDTKQSEPAAKQALERIDSVVSKSKQGGNIARDLARADLKLTVAEFIGVKLISALIGAGIGIYLGRANQAAMFAAALLGAVIFSFAPNFYMGMRAGQRIKSFNNQLGDTITMMANALRGGFSFLQTLDMVAKDAPMPMSAEFRRVVQEVGLGRSTEEALESLLRRMPSEDLDLLITAVNIQMEVGGNLAQILDTIGHTIRERVRIKGEIQTLTAQGRISAWVITGLPVGLAIFITMVNPSYMAPIFTIGLPPENWCCLPVVSLAMIVMGFFIIMKIMDIEV
ncbi:type II secretion system F family protein [Oscillochloris sp. ZM17-4]|uniref:type II secretion system F family protein n=1 Tax=Oscillochloris sp. ZM17-4 TaxID=2866714 RepID=UPI001C72C98D|nr:type II secretion system F family protein [Oscillochloris sp. ZM17-4]MBX0327610.1 type II secretion system F family protein [Oscillochloris sp. ZM17-4]